MAIHGVMRGCLVLVLGLCACTVGSVGDGSDDSIGDDGAGDDSNSILPRVDLTLTPPSQTTELGTTSTFTVTATARNGFSGAVALQVGGVPASWNATLDMTNLTLTVDGTATATLSIAVPASGEARAADLDVSATSSAAPETSPPASLTVQNQLTLRIPA